MGNRRTLAVATSVVGVTLIVVLLVTPFTSADKREAIAESRSTITQDIEGTIDEIHEKTKQNRMQTAAWLSSKKRQKAQFGMEANGAGFHLLRSEDDPYWEDPYTTSDPGYSLVATFTRVEKKFNDEVYIAVPPLPDPRAFVMHDNNVVWVAFGEFVSRSDLASVTSVLDASTGLYNVVGALSSSGFSRLTSLRGSANPNSGYLDWYRIPRGAGEAPAKLRFVMVADNEAHVPISLSAIESSPSPGATFLISKGLSQTESLKIVSRLGF